jgi:phage gp36-like protein
MKNSSRHAKPLINSVMGTLVCKILSYKTSAKRLGSNKRNEFKFEIQSLQYFMDGETRKDVILASELHSELLFSHCRTL